MDSCWYGDQSNNHHDEKWVECHLSFNPSYILGTFGNILTLVALPYVRRKYGTEYSFCN